MANVRLKIFQNFGPALGDANFQAFGGDGSMNIHAVEIPGSISFNTVAMLWSGATNTNVVNSNSKSLTVFFGLYSLNGSTLSLANSASVSTSNQGSTIDWITFATSAAQDILPGNWWFAVISSRSGIQNQSLGGMNVVGSRLNDGGMGGLPVRGVYTVTTNALPATIHTTDIQKEGASGTTINDPMHPLILIAA